MPKETLKVAIIVKRNGKDVAGVGADYTEFFQNDQKLTRKYVIDKGNLPADSRSS